MQAGEPQVLGVEAMVESRLAQGPVRGLTCEYHGGAVSVLLGKRE